VSDAFGATFFDEAIEWGETEVAFVLAPGSDFYIERGTLKLYPGTTVKLSGNSLRVLTIGELTAVGTDAKPIVFTSINDDEYGGRSGCPYPPAAWKWAQNPKYNGYAFFRTLFVHSLVRFFLDFLRQHSELYGPFVLSQIIALAICLVCLPVIIILDRRYKAA
jgi:hypothetical protein